MCLEELWATGLPDIQISNSSLWQVFETDISSAPMSRRVESIFYLINVHSVLPMYTPEFGGV